MTPKYRAWNIKYKRMDEVASVNWLGDGSVGYNGRINGEVYSGGVNMEGFDDEFILMPQTGLKDKKGREIYEGDVVIACNGALQGVVVYQAPSFVIKRKPKHKQWEEFILAASENQFQTVIGNIYENPELLHSGRTT